MGVDNHQLINNPMEHKITELSIVLFNQGMFAATGVSDQPVITIALTEVQIEYINKMTKNYSILSIHPILKEDKA